MPGSEQWGQQVGDDSARPRVDLRCYGHAGGEVDGVVFDQHLRTVTETRAA